MIPHRDHVAIATDYARAVVEGRVLTGLRIRQACERHFRDLDAGRYVFEPTKAARACRFIELLPHVKGRWARSHERIVLSPFQCFIVCSIFGWLRHDGLRRFRRALIELARKNGKSTIAAGIGLYLLCADDEPGAEVYCGATSEDQAWEVFRPAKVMAERTAPLREKYGLDVLAGSLVIEHDNSRMTTVIGKPGDGASPHGALVDEYHEHKTNDLMDTMQTGMGSRDQPLVLITTTAGVDLQSPCYLLHLDALHVLDGTVEDEELFVFIAGIDEGDDWTTDEALLKANPNAGVSVSMDYLRSQQAEARRSSHKAGIFKTKHLNMWVQARTPFFNIEDWNACAQPERAEEFKGQRAIGFLDLASTKDLAALVWVFEDGDGYYVTSRFWIPEARLNEPTAPYRGWSEDGYLAATPGNIIDYDFIEAEILQAGDDYEVMELAYDPFQATQISTRMAAAGFSMVHFGASVKNFSQPMKELDALILSGRIRHDGNPVLTWCMSNVVARIDAKDNVFPRKERDESKIDGAVATIAALGRWLAQAGEDEEKQYFVEL